MKGQAKVLEANKFGFKLVLSMNQNYEMLKKIHTMGSWEEESFPVSCFYTNLAQMKRKTQHRTFEFDIYIISLV